MTYSAARLLARLDAYKRLNCKYGYVQRGAVCQKRPENIFEQEPRDVFTSFKSGLTDYNISLQRGYQDLLQASGIRNVIGGNALTSQNVDLDKGSKLSQAILSTSSTPLRDKRFIESLSGSRADLFLADLNKYDPTKNRQISPIEFAAIRDYGRPISYNLINGTLRGNDELIKEKVLNRPMFKGKTLDQAKKEAKREIGIINKGLTKLTPFNGSVYRGLTLPEDVVTRLIDGGKWQEKGLMSTTKSFYSTYPGNVVFKIQSKSGRDISDIEAIPNQEVLFLPKTKLKVKGYKKIEKAGRSIHYFLMDEVGSASRR